MEEVKKPLPESPEIKEIKEDLAKYQSLQSLANTEGGKVLISSLKTDIANDVHTIISLFKGDEMELRCAVAKLKADLSMYTILIHCEPNVKLAGEALKEALSKLVEIENF